MKKGLEFLLDKYDVNKNVEIVSRTEAIIDGVKCTLLPWRQERRIVELANLSQNKAASGGIQGVSVMRTAHITTRENNLMDIVLKELDICEYVIGKKAKEIFAVGDTENVMNIIMKLENDVICTLELSATLAKGNKDIDKHEIIAEKGVACDRLVDSQTPNSSIYAFLDDENIEYQDVDAELYGLSIDDISIVRQCFDMAQKGYNLNDQVKHLEDLKQAVITSLKDAVNVIL